MNNRFLLSLMAGISCLLYQSSASADIKSALSATQASADFRLRYESVSQDNALRDAEGLTLRSLVGIQTGQVSGFSLTAEMEDNRIVAGQGDFSVGPTGYNPGTYSVIADPETTELHQGFMQYKNEHWLVKAGRQIIALDNHRFVGHVGWRQDWQTFDALTTEYAFNNSVRVFYGFINQRNRIFAEAADIDSNDHLFNVSVSLPQGEVTAYAYFLETDNAKNNGLDTYGFSYKGEVSTTELTWLYGVTFATQTQTSPVTEFSANYVMAEAGLSLPTMTIKASYEKLGSDDGQYGFQTPLATLHKFNGWADQFLNTPTAGLEDMAVSISGQLAGGKWVLSYHHFSADEETSQLSTLGSELDTQYIYPLSENMSIGAKYATYSAEDFSTDTDKLWLWASVKF